MMIRLHSILSTCFSARSHLRCFHRLIASNSARFQSCSSANWQNFRERRHQNSWKYHSWNQNSRNSNYGRNDQQNQSSSNSQSNSFKFGRLVFLPAGVWTSLKYQFGVSTKSKIEEDDQIQQKVKTAMIYSRERKFDEALELLHEALFKAEQDQNESAINYCLDMMANIYYYTGRLDEAERTFSVLIQRLLQSKGTSLADGENPATSPAIVELSLKLADIYAIKGDDEKAESGFEFCITTQKANLEKAIADFKNKLVKSAHAPRHDLQINPESTDPYALYGLVLETYARYLIQRERIDDSQIYINRALEMALEIFGPIHAQTVSLLNNYGVLCLSYQRFDIAEKYLKQVVQRAPFMEQGLNDITGFFTNYAEALWHLGRHDEALDYAKRAEKIAMDKDVSEEARKRTQEYVKMLEASWRKEQKKKKS